MCGISGWFRLEKDMVRESEVIGMLKEAQSRGTDATGIGYYHNEKLRVVKAGVEAKKFVKIGDVRKLLPVICKSRWGLLHTRAATHGGAKDNKNNHPIVSSRGILIHNGIVSVTKKFDAKGQTDSEQILLSIEKMGWKKGMLNVSGSLAIAVVRGENPDIVYLYRHGSPLKVGYDWKRKIIFWGSTYEILPTLPRHFGVIVSSGELDEDRLYRIDKSGIHKMQKVEAGKYKWSGYTGYEKYNRGYDKSIGFESDYSENYQQVFGFNADEKTSRRTITKKFRQGQTLEDLKTQYPNEISYE